MRHRQLIAFSITIGRWVMSNENEFSVELRLAMIEYMLSHGFVSMYRLTGAPEEEVTAAQREMLVDFGRMTFPQAHRLASDHGPDVLQQAFRRLINMQREMMGWAKI
jgi:hypothetical protein